MSNSNWRCFFGSLVQARWFSLVSLIFISTLILLAAKTTKKVRSDYLLQVRWVPYRIFLWRWYSFGFQHPYFAVTPKSDVVFSWYFFSHFENYSEVAVLKILWMNVILVGTGLYTPSIAFIVSFSTLWMEWEWIGRSFFAVVLYWLPPRATPI